jgi:hypothetical protein
LPDDEGWLEETSMGVRQARKAGMLLACIGAACIVTALLYFYATDGLLLTVNIVMVGVVICTIGVSFLTKSSDARIFRKRLRYLCKISPKPFRDVEAFMRRFLDGKYIGYETRDTPSLRYFVGVSGELRAFMARDNDAEKTTRVFGLADLNGTQDEMLADFRSRAVKELGLKEGNLRL